MTNIDQSSQWERVLLAALRISIGWVFLWASIHHYGSNGYVAGFLSSTKTFHFIYGPLSQSAVIGVIAFLVEYGHMLIGLSLISGLLVRVSAPFAILIMLTYWTAHLDFPYVQSINNFLIDEHLIYAMVLTLLILRRAGHYFGLDAIVSRMSPVANNPTLRWLA
ncbi:DoxX family protein [Rhizobium oryzicola]|uniref:DoxX family protein n=1 Tax=Rhizobium oryzicola TaxID=1232668 RepID=A0ABT8T0P8_9HYPH|nr:DoxX family protein [Rhizobium oryzicola]MDO1584090.1 DoxX family protein [Rhizobium oryzicola]